MTTKKTTSNTVKRIESDSEGKTLEVLQALQSQITAQNEVIANLTSRLGEQEGKDPDAPVVMDKKRKPPEDMLLAAVEGMPITDMKLTKKTKTNDNGQTVITGLEATCRVHGNEKNVTITYGDMDNPNDYLNLPRLRFKLVDQLDESGASQIERDKVITSDGVVDEKREVDNRLVPTGRKVQLATWDDFRHYTILVNGEKVTLPQNKIYR